MLKPGSVHLPLKVTRWALSGSTPGCRYGGEAPQDSCSPLLGPLPQLAGVSPGPAPTASYLAMREKKPTGSKLSSKPGAAHQSAPSCSHL